MGSWRLLVRRLSAIGVGEAFGYALSLLDSDGWLAGIVAGMVASLAARRMKRRCIIPGHRTPSIELRNFVGCLSLICSGCLLIASSQAVHGLL